MSPDTTTHRPATADRPPVTGDRAPTPVRRSTTTLLWRRVTGQYVVDEFGLDVELLELVDPAIGVRFKLDVRGAEWVPAEGPAVIVANRRLGITEPIALGRGVRLATGRRVRFLGIPDIAPVGPVLRRAGGAVGHPEELASLLRMGHVVSVPLQRNVRKGRAGTLPPFALEPALAQDVPVIPAAVVGRETGRQWRVVLGRPLPHLRGRGPLAMAELADEARAGVQALLDDIAPPHWLLG